MECIADAGVEALSRAVPQHRLYGSRRPACGQPLESSRRRHGLHRNFTRSGCSGIFVNLEPNEAPDDLLIAEASVPDRFVATLDLALLPPNWRGLNNEICRNLGSDWAASRSSLALKVPSAVVEGEWNVLLNPKHPQLAKVQIADSKPFRYDERMFR